MEEVSFDTLSESVIDQIYNDLSLSLKNVFVCNPDITAGEELTSFHEQLYFSGKTSCAVTCLRSTYQQLQKKGIPCVHLLPTELGLRTSIQQAILIIQSDYFRQSQIAVGLVEIKENDEQSEYESQKQHLELHHKLVNYAKELHAGIFPVENLKFVLYMTWGVMGQAMPNVLEKFMKDLKQTFNSEIYIGLGVGESALTAERRTKLALQYCKRQKQDQCYIALEDDNIVNVLGQKEEKELYRSDYGRIHYISIKYNVSHLVLKRISIAASKLRKQQFTVKELAYELNQTPRNVNRILKELVAKGLASQVGEEHLGGKGRPKIIYKLHFI